MANPEHVKTLQQGVEVWNRWREENQGTTPYLVAGVFTRANLRGANLRGVDFLGANLRGANLSGVNLRQANFKGANLSETNLQTANLNGANLTNANLHKADLQGASLKGALAEFTLFDNVDLS